MLQNAASRIFVLSGDELIVQAEHEDEQDNEGQAIGQVAAHPVVHLEAFAGVDFLLVVVPAPAVAGDAEQQVDEGAQRQEEVADEEILHIQHRAAEDGEAVPGPDVVAQHTGQREGDDEEEVDEAGLLTVPAGQLHAAADDVLEDGQHGGKCRKGHEQKEQAAPQTAHRHICEDVGQGDEDKAGAAGLVHTVSEAGREDDEAGGDGDEGIQHHDADALAQQGVLFVDVAAEDGHCTDAEAQGEERLIHGPHQRIDDAHFLHPLKVGYEEEGQALLCAGHEHAVDCQHHHDDQQSDHHDFRDFLEAVLQTAGADEDADGHNDHHPEAHGQRACQHLGELAGHLVGVKAHQLTGSGHVEVVEHPAGHRGVEHHQQVAADEGEVAVDVPLLAGLFEGLIGAHRALVAGTAHGELHGHDGQAQNDEEQQVEQHESAAAALTCHVGELPHISDADRAASGKEDEPESRFEFFAFH